MRRIPLTATYDNAFLAVSALFGLVYFWVPYFSQFARDALHALEPIWAFREAIIEFSLLGKLFFAAYSSLCAIVLWLSSAWFPRKSEASPHDVFPTAHQMNEGDYCPHSWRESFSFSLYFACGKPLTYIGVFFRCFGGNLLGDNEMSSVVTTVEEISTAAANYPGTTPTQSEAFGFAVAATISAAAAGFLSSPFLKGPTTGLGPELGGAYFPVSRW